MDIASFKNTYFERHLRTAASDSGYILHRKLNKIIQEPHWPFVSFETIKSLYFTYSHSYSFVLSLTVIGCHSLSFFVTRCHSLSMLSFVVTYCTTRYHSLYHSLPRVVIKCTTRCHSLSFVVTRYTLLCLFINDQFLKTFVIIYFLNKQINFNATVYIDLTLVFGEKL